MRSFSFVSIVCATLIACSAAEDETPDGETKAEYVEACEGGTLALAKGFKPEPAVDFIGFRTEQTTPRQVASDPEKTEAVWSASFSGDVFGTLCGGASDKADCEKRVAETNLIGADCNGVSVVPQVAPQEGADMAPPAPGNCIQSYVLYTRGNDIGTVRTADEARALFGAIDSPAEALYLVRLQGGTLSCGGRAPTATRVTDDGYDVRANNPCGESQYHVSKDGTVSLTEGKGACR